MTDNETPRLPEDAADFVDGVLNIKPELMVHSGDLPATAYALRDLFAEAGHLFDRGMPVKLVQPANGGAMEAKPLTVSGVVVEAHRLCQPVKIDHNDKHIAITLPDRIARMYLDLTGEWNLPPLVGISSAPILAADGTISDTAGYDSASGLWCCKVPPLDLPERPRRENAAAALRLLRDAFKTFPFADSVRRCDPALGVETVDLDQVPGQDESGFLAGLLTSVCRAALWLAPGFLVVAPQVSGAGSGKGLLVRAICAIGYGVRPRAFTAGHDRQELDKRIAAELVEAAPALFLDNINGAVLRSDTLASVLTERPSRVRVLGETRMVALNTSAFVAVTGNGLTVSEDLARRFILCELDARCEDPETRPFPSGYLEKIESRRHELLTAVLTILRWGRQNSSSLERGRPLGSFEQWCEWVRDPLRTLGCADPVERIEVLKANDPRRQRLAELYQVWWDHHGDDPVKAADLAEPVRNLIDPQNRGRQFIASYLGQCSGTRAAGFVLDRQQPVGKWGAATYSLKRTGADPDESNSYRGDRGQASFVNRRPERKGPMGPMPDAAGRGDTNVDCGHGRDAQRAGQYPPESEKQRQRAALRQRMAKIKKPEDNPASTPDHPRGFVYQGRSLEDVLNRIRMYEEKHPRRVRRGRVIPPEGDLLDADEEDY
jgi:hypothetical protein